MPFPSRVSAWRRELNSHDAAKPRGDMLHSLRSPQRMATKQDRIEDRLCQFLRRPARNRISSGKSSQERLGAAVPHWTSGLRGKHWSSVSSSGRRAEQGQVCPRQVVRRLKNAAFHGQQRGARSFGAGPRGITGPWQAHRLWLCCAVLPNPSLKWSANGRPPGPGRRYAVHSRQPGPGVLPSSPT